MGFVRIVYYVACFTAEDGLYSCGHIHRTVRSAMNCLIPNGAGFIRAHDRGTFRSLDNMELIDFLESLPEMPWSARYKAAQAGEPAPAAGTPSQEPPVGAGV